MQDVGRTPKRTYLNSNNSSNTLFDFAESWCAGAMVREGHAMSEITYREIQGGVGPQIF